MSTHQARGGALGRLRSNPTIAHVLSRLHSAIVPPLRWTNAGLRALSAGSHHFQYKVEGFLRPSAEWFDHEIDVHWQWVAKQRSMFLERGVLNTLAIRPGGQILEVCCGDGFNAHRFYAERGAHVLAIDYNDAALRHARRYHARTNVEYRGWDIRKDLPKGPFDNIIWDAAIHHFTLAEVTAILASVHRSLATNGVLSGYTVIEPGDDYSYSRLRFSSPETLAEILGAELAHVAILETPDALRRNLYFFASDVPDTLPFAPGIHKAPAPILEPASST